MKVTEVPQDQDPTFEGGKKLCYAVNENGQFTQVKTSGWKIEAEAKDLAWNAIHRDLEKTKNKVQKNQASSLEYYMKLRLMDTRLLAQNMNLNPLRVWWHLRPGPFSRLSNKWLERYADCLKISIESLRSFKGE